MVLEGDRCRGRGTIRRFFITLYAITAVHTEYANKA